MAFGDLDEMDEYDSRDDMDFDDLESGIDYDSHDDYDDIDDMLEAEDDFEERFYDDEFEHDGQPDEYTEWQDYYGGDDWDQGQYDGGEC